MGQKVNPIGIRVGINRTWDSRWFDDRNYADKLIQDLELRKYVTEKLKAAGISKVIIERAAKNTRVTVYTARPGVIIGKKGADIEEGVCQQLERRVSFRRAMKRAVQNALRMGSLGIRLNVSGRLGGADIARTEWYREGRVPLHTLRADMDYGFAEALTTYGIIGVKCWLYKGDVMEHDPMARDKRLSEAQGGPNQGGGRDNQGPRRK